MFLLHAVISHPIKMSSSSRGFLNRSMLNMVSAHRAPTPLPSCRALSDLGIGIRLGDEFTIFEVTTRDVANPGLASK